MEKANFYEIPDAELRSKLIERESHEGIRVCNNVMFNFNKHWLTSVAEYVSMKYIAYHTFITVIQ